MKNTKVIFAALVVVFLFSVVTYTACKNDPCKDVLCQNGGVCNSGSCTCPDGYTGTHCEKKTCVDITCQNGGTCVDGACVCTVGYTGTYCEKTFAAALMGIYSCTETCQSVSSPAWNSQVKLSNTDERRILVTNFGASNEEVTGLVDGNKVTLDAKTIGVAKISGSGTVNGNTIVLSYTYVQGGQTDSCIITMIRQ